jgi:MIP family channel proteins
MLPALDGSPREPMPTRRELLRGAWAEFVAMGFFVFLGCGSAASNLYKRAGSDGEAPEWDSASTCIIALQFGLAITVLVFATAHSSGGHINCAVTFGLTIAGKCHPVRGIVYFAAQMIGSIVGAAVLKGATNGELQGLALDRSGGLGSNGRQNQFVTPGNAFVFECACTCLLVLVVLETAVNPKAVTTDGQKAVLGNKLNLAPIPIGFTVFLSHVVCIPVTGCSINPTRSFGPAVVSGTWDDHWIWWAGPLVGSLIATVVWWVTKYLDDPDEKIQRRAPDTSGTYDSTTSSKDTDGVVLSTA